MLDTAHACAARQCSALGLALTTFMSSTNIEELTVKHFQDACKIEWPNFAQFLAKPKKLHLLITTWCDDASYDYKIKLRYQHALFNIHLNRRWLEPMQSQLTHLSLHCNTYWGLYPLWQPCSLYFPHLRSMSFA
jgi:hypothetical protein